eukprot:TRINITY_DN27255_c0_g1_i1.p1 TRINITY_DN27255_c0_g1~~TRINITY_DN27255_c0_g1_i1.p1  ORF type:complete len:592 (-),score=118.75 TRINITY_DN27255_c0_g1_i1:261-1808(-)
MGNAQFLPQILDASVIRYIYREARSRYYDLKETTLALNAAYLTPIAFKAVYESCRIHLQKKKAEDRILQAWQGVQDTIDEDVFQSQRKYEEMAWNALSQSRYEEMSRKQSIWEKPIKEMISFLSASDDPKLERFRSALTEAASSSSTSLQKLEDLKKMCADHMEELRELQDLLGASAENRFEQRMRVVLAEMTHTHDALKLATSNSETAAIRSSEAAGLAKLFARLQISGFDSNESVVVTDGSGACDDDESQAVRSGAWSKTVKKARQIVATSRAFGTLTGKSLDESQGGRRSVSFHSQTSRIDSRHADERHSNIFARLTRMKLQALSAMGGGHQISHFESGLGAWAKDGNEDQHATLVDPRKSATIVRRQTENSLQDESLSYDDECLGENGSEVEGSGSGADGRPAHRYQHLQEMSIPCLLPDLPAMQPGSAMHCQHRLPRDNLKSGLEERSQISKSLFSNSINGLSRPATVSIAIFERSPQTARRKPLKSCDLHRPWTSIQGAPGITTFQPRD